MTDAELAHTKELAFWMTERVFMNPISAKFLTEDWRKVFPDEVAVAERMKALVEELEAKDARIAGMKAERDEFRRRLNLDRDILADADKRIAELQESNAQVIHSRDHYKHISEELMRRIHELQSRAEAAEKCLSNLAAVSRRYLPDYDEHPEIQAADDLLEQNSLVTAGIQIQGGE